MPARAMPATNGTIASARMTAEIGLATATAARMSIGAKTPAVRAGTKRLK